MSVSFAFCSDGVLGLRSSASEATQLLSQENRPARRFKAIRSIPQSHFCSSVKFDCNYMKKGLNFECNCVQIKESMLFVRVRLGLGFTSYGKERLVFTFGLLKLEFRLFSELKSDRVVYTG